MEKAELDICAVQMASFILLHMHPAEEESNQRGRFFSDI
jgi:hypothetical protein